MLSIFFILFLLVSIIFLRKKMNKKFFTAMCLILVNLFLIEVIIYGYFLFLIFKADCFFLIGNQKVLDALMKVRLSYSTYFAQGKKSFIYQLNNDLGYTVGKNKDAGSYKSNWQGMRNDKEYPLIPQDKLRLAVFGDSFVFCDDEKNKDTWPLILENSVENLEVLNFGVSGYGLGQSYLRYLQDGVRFQPDIIFFNYISIGARDYINPNDFVTSNNLRYATFYRPFFWMENDILLSRSCTPYDLFDSSFKEKFIYSKLTPYPYKKFFQSEIFSISNLGVLVKNLSFKYYYKDKYVSDFEEKEQREVLTIKLLTNLIHTARQENASLVFFCGQPFESLPKSVQKLLNQNKNRVVFVDKNAKFSESLENLGLTAKDIKNYSNHYNAKGNKIYADIILDILTRRAWGDGKRKFKFNAKIKAFEKIK